MKAHWLPLGLILVNVGVCSPSDTWRAPVVWLGTVFILIGHLNEVTAATDVGFAEARKILEELRERTRELRRLEEKSHGPR